MRVVTNRLLARLQAIIVEPFKDRHVTPAKNGPGLKYMIELWPRFFKTTSYSSG